MPYHVIVTALIFTSFFFLYRIKIGVNFQHIEKQFKDRAMQFYVSKQQHCLDMKSWADLHQTSQEHQHKEEFPDVGSFFKNIYPTPSDSYLCDIFLRHFYFHEAAYKESFRLLGGSILLSSDHTFKVSDL